jgi:tetratricopeptide (TPR) repeat protein
LGTSGCSTKKNTWNRRAYHNLTSHYNVYWNGRESLRTGVADLRKNAKDDYMQVLRVFNYGTQGDAQRQYPNMDRAIEKASIGVQKHSMVFGGKERVQWIDDSYLMMAQAHFYKKDFISARRTFEFVASQYSYNDITHTAELWLARTHMEMGQYDRALAILTTLESKLVNLPMPRHVERNFDAVFADYHIATGNHSRALPYLRRAVNAHNDRQRVTRMIFIMAQIHEREGNQSNAMQYYNQVIKRNPVYDLAFQARINLAKAYNPQSDDSRQIIRVLEKMLTDERNRDYRDKIYYALAEVALKDKNEDLAMDHLRKSVATSRIDNNQKAASSLQLADMLFERTKYEPAQAYYDTAVQVLPATYPGYDSIRSRTVILNDLVYNLNNIKRTDSLLVLAAMDSTQLYAVVDKIINEFVREEQRREQEERSQSMMAMYGGRYDQRGQMAQAQSTGEWYFYNQTTLGFGFTEFMRKWGRRQLEDNWRISDRQSIIVGSTEGVLASEGGIDRDDPDAVPLTPRDRDYYLRDIPKTDEEKEAAIESVMESYNNAAYIYKEGLNDYKPAKRTYKELNERFPDNPYRVQAWYALHRMYLEEGNLSDADYYKSIIVNSYPGTDYALILTDPDYFLKLAEERNQSINFYASTYDAYREGQYFRVLMNTNQARTLYSQDSIIMPKFEFLRAIAVGRIQTVDSMAVSLSQLIAKYPDDEVSPLATTILRQLNQDFNLSIEIPEHISAEPLAAPELVVPYTFEPNSMHMVMIITNIRNVRTDPLKVRISDFNSRFFSVKKLMIRSIMLDNERSLVTVGNFDNKAGADDYRSTIINNDYVFGGMAAEDFHVYQVSAANYPVFYREKDMDQYKLFWEKNYK